MSKHTVKASLRHSLAAENLSDPKLSIKDALVLAGYAEGSAKRGMASVPAKVLALMAKKGIRLKTLGEIDADTQEKIVRGRLVHNVIRGKDAGVLSAKALGSDRRVNMFQGDQQLGIIVLSQPGLTTIKSDALMIQPSDLTVTDSPQ